MQSQTFESELSGPIYNAFRQRTSYLELFKKGLSDQQVKQTTTIRFIVMCQRLRCKIASYSWRNIVLVIT